jgi:phage/plasmid-associated DNA primase
MNPQIDIKAIIQEFGPPGYQNDKGQLSKLNEPFWAAYYARNREKIIFEPCEREFYDYGSGSGIYLPKSSDSIRSELSALILGGAQNWPGFGALEQFRNAEKVAGAIAHLRGQVEERDFFNQPSYFAHLGNCSLEFARNGSKFEVKPFSPDHRCRNRSPINYEPKARCPEFQQKLLGHIPQEDAILLQKYAGQCLLGRNLTQRFVILDGVGGSSKSSLVQVLNGIVGPRNVYTLRTKLLDERFEIGRMVGRTLLVSPDVKGNFLNEPGAHVVKSLVGSDTLEGEAKRSNERFPVQGIFNIFITSNCRLCIFVDGDQKAWERRIIIIRFDKPYVGQRMFEIHKYLLDREAPGILNWCISGLSMLFGDYAKTGDVILTPDQQKRVSDLLAESDSLRLFVENEIIRDDTLHAHGASHSLTVEEITTEYIEDCVKVKQWTPLSVTQVEKRLPDLMLRVFGTAKAHDVKRNGKNKRGFWKVRWR